MKIYSDKTGQCCRLNTETRNVCDDRCVGGGGGWVCMNETLSLLTGRVFE